MEKIALKTAMNSDLRSLMQMHESQLSDADLDQDLIEWMEKVIVYEDGECFTKVQQSISQDLQDIDELVSEIMNQ